MKKQLSVVVLQTLKKVEIHALSEKDQFAIVDNIIALSDEVEALSKAEKEAVDMFTVKGYDELEGPEKDEATHEFNTKFMEFMKPRYEAESEVKLKKVTKEGLAKIYKQKGLVAGELALLSRELR